MIFPRFLSVFAKAFEIKIAKMKKGAILINCARADLVVDEDIKDALLSGQLGGFACDVFRGEPASNDATYETVFRNLPNVFLTPHIGGSTVEAQESIGSDVAEKLINYLDTGTTVGSLTVPDLHLPATRRTSFRSSMQNKPLPPYGGHRARAMTQDMSRTPSSSSA